MPEKKGNNVQDFFSKKKRYESLKQQPGESSFRVLYYGGAKGSVPFLWESQPGTPKHTFDDSPLPPLTPPPSYRLSPHKVSNQQQTRKVNSKFFNCSKVFSRANSEKINAAAASPLFYSPPSFSSSSSSSSSSRSSFSPCSNSRKESINKVGPRWSVVKLELEDDEDEGTRSKRSPTSSSTMCFGTPRFKGYAYPVKSVKKMVYSIVGGHGTG